MCYARYHGTSALDLAAALHGSLIRHFGTDGVLGVPRPVVAAPIGNRHVHCKSASRSYRNIRPGAPSRRCQHNATRSGVPDQHRALTRPSAQGTCRYRIPTDAGRLVAWRGLCRSAPRDWRPRSECWTGSEIHATCRSPNWCENLSRHREPNFTPLADCVSGLCRSICGSQPR
jgi:hypothetical protein